MQADEQTISLSAIALQQTARILEGVSDACVVLDRDWKYVYVNAHAGRLFRRPPEQLVGKHIWTEFPEGIDQEFYRAYHRAVETQRFVQLEAYYPPWKRWFENRIFPSPDGLVIFFQDVTERRSGERERRQLASVLEATGDLVLVTEGGGRVQFANAAARELLALDGRARDLEELVAPWALPQLREQAMAEALRLGCWQGETALRRSNGTEVPVLASLVYEKPVTGDAGFLALVARDITERKRAEDQSRHDARMRARAEEMAHFGVWEWNVASDHVQWSDELYRIYGLDEHTFGASLEAFLERVHPDDRVRVRANLDRALREKTNLCFDERILRPDGGTRYLRSWGGIRFSEHGEAVGLTGACLDLTELFEATTELRRNQEWLRMALQASNIGLWEWDLVHGTIAWSPEVEQLFGLPPGTITGTYDGYLRLIHPDDRGRVDAAVKAALHRDDMEYQVLHRVQLHDGSMRWIEGRGRAFSDGDGKRVRMAGSVADVTQRHALEESLRQSQKMEAIGRLAAGVAHDFNNLLTVILSTSDLLAQRAGFDAFTQRGIEEIAEAARRASQLTRQLLTLSRQQLPGVSQLDLNEIIDASATMLRRLLPENVRLVVELEPSLWAVRGDRGQIEQVLLNLVVNARDAMPAGGELRIVTRNAQRDVGRDESSELPGPHVTLTVSDTGTGMTAEVRARAFEPFFTTSAEISAVLRSVLPADSLHAR